MNIQLSLLGEVEAPQEPALQPPVTFTPDCLPRRLRNDFLQMPQELDWQRNSIEMYGNTVPMPRDEPMFGDGGETYQYNGLTLQAQPYPDFLFMLKDMIEQITGYQFGVAIGNRYHHGQDSIGWHADDSPEIGERPAIASISLGDTRRFKLRHNKTKQVFDYELSSGALLVMHPGCQQEWQHCIPKTKAHVGTRINWTFRPYVGAIA